MKITVEFENGMTLTAKPENLQLINTKDLVVVAAKGAEGAPVSLFAFNGQLATEEEIAARVKVAPAAPPAAPPVVPPAAVPTPAVKKRR